MKRIDTPDHWTVRVADIRRLSDDENGSEAYSDRALQGLVLFIEAHGPRALQPVMLSPDYVLVDGYARLDAAILAGLKSIPAWIYIYGDRREMIQHRLALNGHRAHLDATIQAKMAARLQTLCQRAARRLEVSPLKANQARAKALRALAAHEAAGSAGGAG